MTRPLRDHLRATLPGPVPAVLTADRLREVLTYNPETGLFTWTNKVSSKKSRRLIGANAGCICRYGYRVIRVDGKLYRGNRLAWLYVFGVWPDDEVDHINGVRSDDRLVNLRAANRSQNCTNTAMPRNNTSGYKGVSWTTKENKWRARFGSKLIGTFDDPKEAHEAYLKYARSIRGEYVRGA